MTAAAHAEHPHGHAPRGRGLLAGRSVLVTAAAGTGIGFATARRCAQEGAEVMLSDRHEARLAECADRLAREIGRPVAHRVCDVRSDAEVRKIASKGNEPVYEATAIEGIGVAETFLGLADLTWAKLESRYSLEEKFGLHRAEFMAQIRLMLGVDPQADVRPITPEPTPEGAS